MDKRTWTTLMSVVILYKGVTEENYILGFKVVAVKDL